MDGYATAWSPPRVYSRINSTQDEILSIHKETQVIKEYSIFTIGVIVVVSFLIIMTCIYRFAKKATEMLLGKRRVLDNNNRIISVYVIQSRTPPAPLRPDVVDASLQPYKTDPPPDYFKATGTCPEDINRRDESTQTSSSDRKDESSSTAASVSNGGT